MPKRILITGGVGFVGHHLLEGVLKQTEKKPKMVKFMTII